MVEEPYGNEVVPFNECAFRSVNVTNIANLKKSTATNFVDVTFHVWIERLVDVTNWCNYNFPHLGRQTEC
jgi:hypothetical protein